MEFVGRSAAAETLDLSPDVACVDASERLAELSRSRGALRRVLAGLAAAFVARRRWDALGYVRVGDFARERLGMSGRSLHDLARVGAALAELPRLEAALVSGALPWSKVRLLARCARPEDEAAWIARARGMPVRVLERWVRMEDPGSLHADWEEPRETVGMRVGSRLLFQWQHAREWASRVAGESASPAVVLEMVTAESLSALPAGALEEELEPEPPPRPPLREMVKVRRVAAESEDELPGSAGLPGFLAPLLEGLEHAEVFELERRLRRAVRLEQRLDAELAPWLRRMAEAGHGLGVLAREEVGISPRKARALRRLERAGDVCPALRRAFRSGALSWGRCQVLVPLLGIEGAEDRGGRWRLAWVRLAQRITLRRLEEAVGRALALREGNPQAWRRRREDPEAIAAGGRQECARPEDPIPGIRWRVTAPREVARLFRAVLGALRRARRWSEAEALGAMLDHALRAWGVGDASRHGLSPRAHRILSRDGWRCAVPGCTSYRNLQLHHLRFRSAGGSDADANLLTLCAGHHLRGVHAGAVRVRGRAPDGLVFELGVRPGLPPLARYRSGDRVVSAFTAQS